MGSSDALKGDNLSILQLGAFKFKCDWSVLLCLLGTAGRGSIWVQGMRGVGVCLSESPNTDIPKKRENEGMGVLAAQR